MLTDLYKYLLCPGNNDHFLSIMSIRKGRKLVARVLPLLEKVRLFVLLISLLINLTTSRKSKITGDSRSFEVQGTVKKLREIEGFER